MHQSSECPRCKTPLKDAPGIGMFCPNPDCEVVDGILLYNEQGEKISDGLSIGETKVKELTLKDLDGENFKVRLAGSHSRFENKAIDALIEVENGIASLVFEVSDKHSVATRTSSIAEAITAYNNL